MILWVIGIRLKEADSGASRCRDINFFQKKTQMFQIFGNLDLFTNHLNPQTEDILLFKESFLPTNHSLFIAPTIILS